MRAILTNLGCLILAILLFPLFVLFIGPLLVLAAWRGRQPVGPIILNTVRYGLVGRIGALLLGLAIWILVWSGLAWLVINGLLSSPAVVNMPPGAPPTTISIDISTPQAEARGEPEELPERETPTPLLPTFTPTHTVTLPPPSATVTSTRAPTTLAATDTPTATPASSETAAGSAATPTTEVVSGQPAGNRLPETEETPTPTGTPPPATLTFTEREAIIAAVEEGNILLRESISLANRENLEKLESVWQGLALDKAQNFAARIYERYAKPLDVQFEYIVTPTVTDQSVRNQATVVSHESWTYGTSVNAEREAFEFTYILDKEEGRWVITQYSYRNLPTPAPATTPKDAAQ